MIRDHRPLSTVYPDFATLPIHAPVFFRSTEIGAHPARHGAVARLQVSNDVLFVRFDCPLAGEPAIKAIKPVGDPDVFRDSEYIRVMLHWGLSTRDQIHWTVAVDGQAVSEHGDRRNNALANFNYRLEHQAGHWSVQLALPLDFLDRRLRSLLRVSLFRCTADESITSWPSPFGQWLFARPEGSIPLHDLPSTREDLILRAEKLRHDFPYTLRSFPDDVPDWPAHFARLLLPDLSPQSVAQRMHERALANPVRTFMTEGAAEEGITFDLPLNLELLDEFDATGTARRRGRGEMLVNVAAVYHRDGDEALRDRAQRSLQIILDRHDVTENLQRLSPAARWATHLGLYTHSLLMRAAHLLSIRRPMDNMLLCRLLKLGHELFWYGNATIAGIYHFNHSVNWCDKVLEIAALAPDLRDADLFRQLAWYHMERSLQEQILPDGISQELCSSYNLVAYYRLLEGIDACQDSALHVPPHMLAWAERMLAAGTVYLLPNGANAGFGDGHMGVDEEGFVRAGMTETGDNHCARDGKRFGRPDLLFIGTGGRAGAAPAFTDNASLYGGVYAARTGWTHDDAGLILDAGPLGRAHQHYDRLNFIYSYKDRCLVIDGLYDTDPQFRTYSCGEKAHNVLTVDGYRPDYVGNFDLWVNRTPMPNRFEERDGVHYLEALHHLVKEDDPSQEIEVHRRIITRLKQFVWIVDSVRHVPSGARLPTVEGAQRALFSLHTRLQLPRGRVTIDGPLFRTHHGRIDLAGFSPEGLPPRREQGLWSAGPDSRNTLLWTDPAVELPHHRSLLLLPFENGRPQLPQATSRLGENVCELALIWPSGTTEDLRW